MAVKFVHNGMRVHGPPYTKAEERAFYRSWSKGPKTVLAGKNVASPQPPVPPPAAPAATYGSASCRR